MNQDRHITLSGVRQAPRLARPGFERPVEHLHFDRVARVWRRHADGEGLGATSVVAAGPAAAGARCE